VKLLDVTLTIRPGMLVYPGDPEVHLERQSSIAAGAPANISRLDLGVHTGTHVDAPLHFIDGAAGAEALPLEALVGPVHVVDATSLVQEMDDTALDRLDLPEDAERLLFKTRNSDLWDEGEFSHDFIRFVESGARRVVDMGVRLVGIDYLSIGDEEAHHVLLGAGVVAVEGLDLRSVAPGAYTLICMPMKIAGSDGAPARVLLAREC
jgi:arylformamidase